jgi:hypothetical protein
MKLQRISYKTLNARQREIYNFHKVAALLAEYGFNCIKLSDDWQGADFLAYHKDGNDTLKVQLKSRLTIDKKYIGKKLYIAFPTTGSWCLVEHDALIEHVREHTKWLNTKSWRERGLYHSDAPSAALLGSLAGHILMRAEPNDRQGLSPRGLTSSR